MSVKKAKNMSATGVLCIYRDQLRKEAIEIIQNAQSHLDQLLNGPVRVAKQELHHAKIQANALNKEADFVQECISEEMQAVVTENQKLQEDYKVKSYSEMMLQNHIEGEEHVG